MTGPRVVLLSQWYPPEPAYQPEWIVDALRDQGAVCGVVTGIPNYPTGITMKGYRAWRRVEENRRGVPVLRTPLYPDHGRNPIRRLLNYTSWAVSSALFGRRALAAADVVLVYSSPATAALAAWVAHRMHGVPYVLLIQDVWPDTITQSGMLPAVLHRPVEAVLDVFVRSSYRQAAALIVTSPGMQELLVERGVPASRISLVYNWVSIVPSTTPLPSLRTSLQLPEEALVVMYAGNHGAAQGLGQMLDAMDALPKNLNCHLALVGDGIEKRELRRRAAGMARVHFLDPQDPATAQAWMREADAMLVSLVDRPLFNVTTPSKLQMAMALGRPVVALARGDVAEAVEEAGAGVTALPGDRSGLAAALTTLSLATEETRTGWGENARRYYEENMSRDVGADRVMSVLRSVTDARSTAGLRRQGAHR